MAHCAFVQPHTPLTSLRVPQSSCPPTSSSSPTKLHPGRHVGRPRSARPRSAQPLSVTYARGPKSYRRDPSLDPSVFLSPDDDLPDPELLASSTASPLFAETLALLDWPALSRHVAKFAATTAGKASLSSPGVPIPPRRAVSEELLAETKSIIFLLKQKGVNLDFGGVRDVVGRVKYAAKGGTLSVEDLFNVVTTVEAGRKMKIQIEKVSEDCRESVWPLLRNVQDLETFRKLEREVTEKIDDGAMVIRDSASPKLSGIRDNIQRLEAGIKDVLNEVMNSKADALQDKVIAKRYDRLVLAVKAGMKSKIPGIVHDTSATGSTLFIEPKAAADMNAKLRQVRKKEEEEVERILQEISERVGQDANGIIRMINAITRLDVATARAKHGIAIGAVEPKFIQEEAEPIEMRSVRHPLLLWNEIELGYASARSHKGPPGSANLARRKEAMERIVANDFTLGRKVKCAIITGPNTGGKTVSLKTFGVSVLMARAGLYVLADGDEVRMPYFDLVLADIGDEQSITQSLSTFSGHIERVKKILQVATKDSLVLLDEVGSGTDPAEGSALGIALLRHLIRQTRLTFASTHHGELKTLKYMDTDGRFENASMEFDDEKMKPTFRLIWGIPGRSNALAIASRLGLHPTIIESAKDALAGTSVDDVNQVITALESQRLEAEKYNAEVRKTLDRTKSLESEAKKKLAALEKSEREMKEAKQESIEAELASAQNEIASVIRKMQTEGTSQAAAAARAQLGGLKPNTRENAFHANKEETQEEDESIEYVPRVGDHVTISRLGSRPVEILDYTSGRSDMIVGFGAMKVKVLVSEVTSKDTSVAKEEAASRRATRARLEYAEKSNQSQPKRVAVRHAQNTCDVRGLTVDEAIPKVDDIIAAGIRWGACWIIHGFGPAGRLRRGVREHLRKHPNVASIEDADQHDGGAGATIVRVK